MASALSRHWQAFDRGPFLRNTGARPREAQIKSWILMIELIASLHDHQKDRS
jgi:hypothetical protein